MGSKLLPLDSLITLGVEEYKVISEAREAVEVTEEFTVMGDVFYYLRNVKSGNVYEYRGEDTLRLI